LLGSVAETKLFWKFVAIVDLIKPGDQIMVDKGFLIDEDVITRGGVVIRPASKNAKQQFNPQQVESSRKIASVQFVAMTAFWNLRLANFNSLIERLSNAW
jgi:hypothetical protein